MYSLEAIPIRCERALAPTGIKIAQYTLNPYRGCEYGCLYCYSQKNKCFNKNKKTWGAFIDIKTNFIEKLSQELEKNKPEKVLIGSTTEAYQPVEEKYQLTRKTIELLNRYKIPMVILTKSDLVLRDIDILKDAKLCFTINMHEDKALRIFEKKSPGIKERLNAVKKLKENNISVYIHCGPVFPGITDVSKIMEEVFGLTERINFESFNYWMSPALSNYNENTSRHEKTGQTPLLSDYKSWNINWLSAWMSMFILLKFVSNCRKGTFSKVEILKICRIM